MAQVEGLVGVGGAILDHNEGRTLVRRLFAVVGGGVDVGQQLEPSGIGNAEVQESLHHVVLADGFAVLNQIVAQLLGGLLRRLARHLDKGEHHEGQIALKLAARLLQLYHLFGHVLSVKSLYGGLCSRHYLLFNIHILNVKRLQRYE